MGIMNSEKDDEKRELFKLNVKNLFKKLYENLNLDDICDILSTSHWNEKLPLLINQNHITNTILDKKSPKELNIKSQITLIKKSVIRLAIENDQIIIFHILDNARRYKEKEPQYFQYSMEYAPAFETLINSYPNFVTIGTLPFEGDFNELLVILNSFYKKKIFIHNNL
jgi:bifunctional lysine-specific demethylase and histidyl-hydroxylase NO66